MEKLLLITVPCFSSECYHSLYGWNLNWKPLGKGETSIQTTNFWLQKSPLQITGKNGRKWQGTGASRELHNWPAPLGEPPRGPRLVGGCIDVLLVVYYS